MYSNSFATPRREAAVGILVAIVLFVGRQFVDSHPLNLKPNRNWDCIGCIQDADATFRNNRMFGIIRTAIMRDPRITYLNLDMTWLDRLLGTDTRARVRRLRPGQIRDTVMPKLFSLPRGRLKEVFELAYSEISGNKSSNFLPEDIDKFLLNNPCWVPIHEPIYNFTTYPILDKSGNGSFVFKPRSFRRMSKYEQHHLELEQQQQHKFVLFARLPVFGFHATCRLYTQITKHQFPTTCNYNANNMSVHHVGNIGWSNTINGMMFKFVEIFSKATYPTKVFVIPRASSFRERIRWAHEKNGDGSIFKLGGGWAWVEPTSCDPDIEFYNPWACHFIPISNCTDKHTQALLQKPLYPPEAKDQNFNTPEAIFEPGFGAETNVVVSASDKMMTLQALRVQYEDAPRHDETQWTYGRFYAFIQVDDVIGFTGFIGVVNVNVLI